METLLNAHVFRALICPVVHEISRELAFSEAVKVPISEVNAASRSPRSQLDCSSAFSPIELGILDI